VLDAGIDVYSTVNVQHLESSTTGDAADGHARTGDDPRRVLSAADEVVLIDLTPEALIGRLRAARSIARARAGALNNFFKIENLSRCARPRCVRWRRM